MAAVQRCKTACCCGLSDLDVSNSGTGTEHTGGTNRGRRVQSVVQRSLNGKPKGMREAIDTSILQSMELPSLLKADADADHIVIAYELS